MPSPTHGYPRATEDIDLWVAYNPENAERIVAALRKFGFDLPELTPELFLMPDTIVRMGLPPRLGSDECGCSRPLGRRR